MKKIIDKLNFNIDEFKNNYWYSKTIEIPQFIKNIEPNISEIDLFNKLLFNVFQTCDLFINQKMSQFLALDLTLEQIIEILSQQRVSNFLSSVYTEIKYRLATEKFPEFSQKDKLITSNFSLATAGREFNNFQSLLSAEAIAYLTYPSWNDLKINKDDYLNITSVLEKLNQFDSKIEKLLKDNSELDENLKLSFSKFKSDQLSIHDKKENKLSDSVRNFLNNNIESSDYLGAKEGNDYIKITFANGELGMDVCGEQYQTYIRPEGIKIASAGEGIDLSYDEISFPHPDDESKPKQIINYDKLKSLYENLDKLKLLENKVNSINSALEKLNEFDTKIEKLLKDNSESDENLKTSLLSFKLNQENETTKINSKIDNNVQQISNLKNEFNSIKTSIDTVKASKDEFDKLKEKDVLIIKFINLLLTKNLEKLNLDFIKSDFIEEIKSEEQPSKYTLGDIIEFKNKKIFLISKELKIQYGEADSSGNEVGTRKYYYEWKYYELN